MTIQDAKEAVMSCVNAINREDFTTARQYVADDISFVGVLGSRHGADSYFTDMERMRLKYDVKKVFVDGNDVAFSMISPYRGLPFSGVHGIRFRIGRYTRSK